MLATPEPENCRRMAVVSRVSCEVENSDTKERRMLARGCWVSSTPALFLALALGGAANATDALRPLVDLREDRRLPAEQFVST